MIERFIKPESILGKEQIYKYRLITSLTHKEFFQNEILRSKTFYHIYPFLSSVSLITHKKIKDVVNRC